MSFNLSINFDTFEDLQSFMIEFNRFKKIQDKKLSDLLLTSENKIKNVIKII